MEFTMFGVAWLTASFAMTYPLCRSMTGELWVCPINRLPQSPQPTAGLTRIAAAVNVANPIGQLGSSGSDARVFGRVERPLAPRPGPPHQFARGHHLAVQGDKGLPDSIAHPAAPDPFHWYTSLVGGLFLRYAARG
jgi:hypothetical protein